MHGDPEYRVGSPSPELGDELDRGLCRLMVSGQKLVRFTAFILCVAPGYRHLLSRLAIGNWQLQQPLHGLGLPRMQHVPGIGCRVGGRGHSFGDCPLLIAEIEPAQQRLTLRTQHGKKA